MQDRGQWRVEVGQWVHPRPIGYRPGDDDENDDDDEVRRSASKTRMLADF